MMRRLVTTSMSTGNSHLEISFVLLFLFDSNDNDSIDALSCSSIVPANKIFFSYPLFISQNLVTRTQTFRFHDVVVLQSFLESIEERRLSHDPCSIRSVCMIRTKENRGSKLLSRAHLSGFFLPYGFLNTDFCKASDNPDSNDPAHASSPHVSDNASSCLPRTSSFNYQSPTKEFYFYQEFFYERKDQLRLS
ncbi:hypothetical protein BC829DRAFT_403380 [Chytridium lagenaria]|nr:hypothetical protein BC829DRAFT_403380 [Chytridium lagenaria]